jgi:hypothetical protein
MIFHPLIILFLVKFLSAVNLQKGKDLIFFIHSLHPMQENVAIVSNSESARLIQNFVHDQDPIKLIELMLNEPSEEFLTACWYSSYGEEIVIFDSIDSILYSKVTIENKIPAFRGVFKNFRIFVSSFVSKLKHFYPQGLYNSSSPWHFLRISKKLWYSKLFPLAKKLLPPEVAEEWNTAILERISFLDVFLTLRIEHLLIDDFKRNVIPICDPLLSVGTRTIKNFCFLVSHFARHFVGPNLIPNLRLVAERDSIFIVYFFYFLKKSYLDENPDRAFYCERIDIIQDSIDQYLSIKGDKLIIFGTTISESSDNYNEILKLVKLIIFKAKVFGSLTPTDQTLEVYKREEDEFHELAINRSIGKEGVLFLKHVCLNNYHLGPLDEAELFKAMLLNKTDNILISFLFSYRNDGSILFGSVDSLLKSKSRGTCNFIKFSRIFRNFKTFVSKAILKLRPINWSNYTDSSAGFHFLNLSKLLWRTKLEPLGKEILTGKKFEIWKNIIEERFVFLEMFLSRPIKDLLIESHQILLPKIKEEIDLVVPTEIQNFCFLAKYFGSVLGATQSPEFYSNFEFLAGQPWNLIIPLFYFFDHSYLDNYRHQSFRDTWEKKVHLMSKSVRCNLYDFGGELNVFDGIVPKSHEHYADIFKIFYSIRHGSQGIYDKIRYK